MRTLITAVVLTQTSSTDINWLIKALVIAVVVGIVVGIIYSMSLKSQLTSVYKNDTAADYTRDKSFKVLSSHDTFLYSKVEKTEKPKEEPRK